MGTHTNPLPPTFPACLAIAREAGQWVIARVQGLPHGTPLPQTWPEYPALLAHEGKLDRAGLAGDLAQTRDAARTYCAAWLDSIKLRRYSCRPTPQ